MFQSQLINTVVEWEWRLKIEEEKRNNLKGEPYKDISAAPHPCQKERKSSFMQIFKRGNANQPVYYCHTYDQCWEK